MNLRTTRNLRTTAARTLATGAAAGMLLGGAAAIAHADAFYQPVGAEACIGRYAQQVRVEGSASPYQARFQVKFNGVVLYQGTSYAYTAVHSVGFGYYQFCGKNKLGNPGPIVLNLGIS